MSKGASEQGITFGFSFLGEDLGATRVIQGVEKNFSKLSNGLGSLKDKVGKTASAFGSSMSSILDYSKKAGTSMGTMFAGLGNSVGAGIGKLAGKIKSGLGGAAGKLDNFVERAMNPRFDGDNSAAQFMKTWRAMTVGVSASAKDIAAAEKSILTAGIQTGESMEDLAKGFLVAMQNGVDLEKAMGEKGLTNAAKTLAKITAVMGVDAGQLVQTFARLKSQFKVTEPEAMKMADRIFVIGKHFGVGREAMQQWPTLIEEITKQFADMGRDAKPEDIAKYAESITMLGGALSKGLGKNAGESLELSKTLFQTLVAEKQGIINMFRGMDGEMGKLGNALAETGGDVDKMFKLIQSDPMKFMEGMQKMADKATKDGGKTGVQFQRLAGVITNTLGPDVTNLVRGGWENVSTLMKGLPKELDGASGAMKNASVSAHKFVGSGDMMSAMLGAFDARLNAIVRGRQLAWFENMRKGFRTMGDSIEKLATSKDQITGLLTPVGELGQRLLLVRQVGLSGLFSQTGAGAKFGMIATQATAAMGALQHLGIRLADLPALFATGGPIMLGFALFDKGLRNTLIGSVKQGAEWLKKKGPDFLAEGVKGFSEAFSDVMPMLVEGFHNITPLVDGMLKWFETALPIVINKGSEFLQSAPVQKFVSGFGGFLMRSIPLIVQGLKAIWDHVLLPIGKDIMKGIGKSIFNEKATLGSVVSQVGTVISAAILTNPALMSLGWKLASMIGGPITGLIVLTTVTLASMTKDNEDFVDRWNSKQSSMSDKAGLVFGQIGIFAMRMLDTVSFGLVSYLIGGFDDAVEKMEITWHGFGFMMQDMMVSGFNAIGNALYKFTSKMGDGLYNTGTWIVQFWDRNVTQPLKIGWNNIQIMALRSFRGVVSALSTGGHFIESIWHGLLSRMSDMFADFLKSILPESAAGPIIKKLKDFAEAQKLASIIPSGKSSIEQSMDDRIESLLYANSESDSATSTWVNTRNAALKDYRAQQDALNDQGNKNVEAWRAQQAQKMLAIEDRIKAARKKKDKPAEEAAKKEKEAAQKATPPVVAAPSGPGIVSAARGGAPEQENKGSSQNEALLMAQLYATQREVAMLRAQVSGGGNQPVIPVYLDGRKIGDNVNKNNAKNGDNAVGNMGGR